MYNVGQKVRVNLNPLNSRYGQVVGHGMQEEAFTGEMVPMYLIELADDAQFWDARRTVFVSTIVAHPDNVEKI